MKQLAQLLLLLLSALLCGGCGSRVKVTVKVIDDDNQPVSKARVVVMGINTKREGTTDQKGQFVSSFRNPTAQLDFLVEKKGFYRISWFTYHFSESAAGEWQPWNPLLALQLRRHGRPVPMIAKQVDESDIPAVNQVKGFDLVTGDWVEPDGGGKVSDLLIKVTKPAVDFGEHFMRLRLTCPNPGDGLVLKRLFWRDDYGLRLPAIAPENGYSNCWEWQACSGTPVPQPGWNVLKNGDQDANFYMRIRTQTNQQGQIVSALYGKIYNGIQFGSATYPETTPLHFLYYLNPDGTRNTEWDTRSNLCADPGDVGGRP